MLCNASIRSGNGNVRLDHLLNFPHSDMSESDLQVVVQEKSESYLRHQKSTEFFHSFFFQEFLKFKFRTRVIYIQRASRAGRSTVDRLLCKQKAQGSNPCRSTIFLLFLFFSIFCSRTIYRKTLYLACTLKKW